MDELVLEGKKHISARRAAKEHGYASDYIGQLIRSGKIKGQKVGKAWFVEEESLSSYLKISPEAETKIEAPLVLERKVPLSVPSIAPIRIQSVPVKEPVIRTTYPYKFELLTYLTDEEALIPTLEKNFSEELEKTSLPEKVASEEMRGLSIYRVEDASAYEHKPASYGLAYAIGSLIALLFFVGFLIVSEQHLSYDGGAQSASSYLSFNFGTLFK
jgi:hypothetical protein